MFWYKLRHDNRDCFVLAANFFQPRNVIQKRFKEQPVRRIQDDQADFFAPLLPFRFHLLSFVSIDRDVHCSDIPGQGFRKPQRCECAAVYPGYRHNHPVAADLRRHIEIRERQLVG